MYWYLFVCGMCKTWYQYIARAASAHIVERASEVSLEIIALDQINGHTSSWLLTGFWAAPEVYHMTDVSFISIPAHWFLSRIVFCYFSRSEKKKRKKRKHYFFQFKLIYSVIVFSKPVTRATITPDVSYLKICPIIFKCSL